MLRTVKEITKRLVEHYEPDRIILFGSHGTERGKADSDIDLLVVKETDKPRLERQVEVERILSDRLVPVDVMVYTPAEITLLFSIGSPFVEEVMEKGRLLYMRRVTTSWLKDAEDELESGLVLFEHAKHRASCYHIQQAVEKALKALILEKGKRPDRIHDLVELRNQAEKLGWKTGLLLDDAIFLNSIYRGRYPTEEGLLPYGEPSREDTERSISAARALMGNVRAHLLAKS